MRYSVIIGVYNGAQNVPRILGALRHQTKKPEKVFVWANRIVGPLIGATTVQTPDNLGCFARFSLVGVCQTEAVMVLDDDTVPGCKWAENCINVMEAHKRDVILGCRGIILKGPSYAPFKEAGLYGGNIHTQECDLVGHSWFFMREHGHFMFDRMPVLWSTGEDMHFSAHAKMAGIRTYCPPHPKSNRDAWGSTEPRLGGAPGRLHTSGPKGESFRLRGQVVKGLIDRGWRPLFKEK